MTKRERDRIRRAMTLFLQDDGGGWESAMNILQRLAGYPPRDDWLDATPTTIAALCNRNKADAASSSMRVVPHRHPDVPE